MIKYEICYPLFIAISKIQYVVFKGIAETRAPTLFKGLNPLLEMR
jgi:hypothetical protein